MHIMDVILILFKNVKLDRVVRDSDGFPEPSEAMIRKVFMDPKFYDRLKNFPGDSLNAEDIDLITPYLRHPDYTRERAERTCKNLVGMLVWTKAMADFYHVNKDVIPLKNNLALQARKQQKAESRAKEALKQLNIKKAEVAQATLKKNEAEARAAAAQSEADACQAKMDAATDLINGLAGEKVRWTEQSTQFKSEIDRLVGDVVILTGFLSYCGPFNQEYREKLQKSWYNELNGRRIPVSANINVIDYLTDSATIGEWNLQGLPTDDLSIQNGIVVTKAPRFPLLIDPQSQGKMWILKKEKENNLIVTSLDHKYFRSQLEDAVSLGYPIVIEDVLEELDPALDNILEKNHIKVGNSFKVKVGDKEIDVHENFRIYITTKLANPSYSPEVSARTVIIDFAVTMKGLEDQLLGRVILAEKRDLETERTQLLQDVNVNKRKMQELETNLLHKLSTCEGSLLDDITVVQVLNVSKATAIEVQQKLRIAVETEKKINTAREEFRPVATRGSVLYFLIVTMASVNCMYQTSLVQFLERFDLSLSESKKTPITNKRIAIIIDYLTYDIYKYKLRGLYEIHKFLFVLLMTLNIDLQRLAINHEEFQVFIKGGAALDLNACPHKPFKWITDLMWLNVVRLSELQVFTNIITQITNHEKQWKFWFEKTAPEKELYPGSYNDLDAFHKLLLIRSWCPDRTLSQAREYIKTSLDSRYTDPVIVNYDLLLEESRPLTPIVCFLSMGSDPTPSVEALAKKNGTKINCISMGQGQEVHARKLMIESLKNGTWVLFQNCHLGLEYMGELVLQLNELEKHGTGFHENFRLWITTEVHPHFPITLLQISIKYTNEPPAGVRAGLKRTYQAMSVDLLEYSESPYYLPLIYAVSFLHTIVQERRKFGPLGWNIPYEFNSADWLASCYFMQNHLESLSSKRTISWSTIRYMIAEVQYGGRVTDDFDKRLLNTFARTYFGQSMFEDDYEFFKGYKIMKHKEIEEYLKEIEEMAEIDPPQVYGLHPNADITYQSNMTEEILSTMVSVQPKESSSGSGETREATVTRQVNDMLAKLPPDYDPFEVKDRLKVLGPTNPLTIFLRQEIDRIQKVTHAIQFYFLFLVYVMFCSRSLG